MKGLGKKLALGIGFAAAVSIGLGIWSDLGRLMEVLTSFDASMLPLVLAMTLLGYALRVVRWHVYLGRQGIRLGRLESVLLFQSGMVLTITPGKIGEVVKSFLLKEARGISIARSAPIVAAERITDFTALLILATIGVVATGHDATIVVVGASLVGLAIVLLVVGPTRGLMIAALSRLPLLRSRAQKVEELLDGMGALIHPPLLAVGVGIALAAWSCEAWGLHLLITAFPGTSPDPGAARFAFAVSTVAGALSMLPGGVGAVEGSLVALLNRVLALTPNVQVATAVTLLARFTTLWFGVALGALALLSFRKLFVGTEPPTDETREVLEEDNPGSAAEGAEAPAQ